MSNIIIKGSNVLLSRLLFQSDGVTVLPPSTLTACTCELIQGGAIVETLTLGTTGALRANDDDTGLLLELTTAITNALAVGRLTERYKLKVSDAEYVAEPDESIKQVEVTQITIRNLG